MRQVVAVTRSLFQEIGVVVSASGGRALTVETPSGRFDALRAASCLLAPAEGDRVLLAVPSEGELYVLAVLEREEVTPSRIELGEDAVLSAGRRVALEAREGIALKSAGCVRVASQEVQVSADEGTFAIKQASWMTGALKLYADVMSAVATRIQSHVEQVTHHAKSSQRFIEDLDLTRAGSVDVRADGLVKVRGENTFVAADELVKLDGEQIHLG